MDKKKGIFGLGILTGNILNRNKMQGFQIYRKGKSIFGQIEEVRGEYCTRKEAEEHLTPEMEKAGFTIRSV